MCTNLWVLITCCTSGTVKVRILNCIITSCDRGKCSSCPKSFLSFLQYSCSGDRPLTLKKNGIVADASLKNDGCILVMLYFLTRSPFDFSFLSCCPQMACFDSSKGSLEEDSYEGGELSNCAMAMLNAEKEQESMLSPSESPGTFISSNSSSLQAAVPLQGYDVEFDPPLESKYECPICLMALRNAIQTPCGHRFCKNCIEKSIRYATV